MFQIIFESFWSNFLPNSHSLTKILGRTTYWVSVVELYINLFSYSMTNNNAADNKAAARYGYARIGVSSPDGHWTFGFVLFVYFWKAFLIHLWKETNLKNNFQIDPKNSVPLNMVQCQKTQSIPLVHHLLNRVTLIKSNLS